MRKNRSDEEDKKVMQYIARQVELMHQLWYKDIQNFCSSFPKNNLAVVWHLMLKEDREGIEQYDEEDYRDVAYDMLRTKSLSDQEKCQYLDYFNGAF